MHVELYQVDAFTDRLFAGNPAAVCPLAEFLPDEMMQAIASENNLSETAFFTGQDGEYQIRWFTPDYEVDLCGHATLASAYVIFNYIEHDRHEIRFNSKSGPLSVKRIGKRQFQLDFPAIVVQPVDVALTAYLGVTPVATLANQKRLLVILDDPGDVIACQFDYAQVRALGFDCVIVSSQADEQTIDFVSRFFALDSVIAEDPVTGSAHCLLAPYWAGVLEKKRLFAQQVSKRGGDIICEVKGERVYLTGEAILYMQGTLNLPI